jgi:hypothetical protein
LSFSNDSKGDPFEEIFSFGKMKKKKYLYIWDKQGSTVAAPALASVV